LKKIEVKKGQILQRKGDYNSRIYHVENGLLRSYIIDDNGKEHIYMFAPEKWIVGDSSESNTPCQLYIDAIEDSVLLEEEKEETLQNTNSKTFMKRLNTLQNRVLMLMSVVALERYEHFIATYPSIIQRVPQRMIASYLGITPEALSRVRKEISLRK
jgi:CRP-like cAMP-binding protein